MASVTTNTCVLTFNTSLDRTCVVRIPDPRPSLTSASIGSAAGGFIAVNPFDESVGALTGLARADLVVQTTTPLI
ncbi:MAG: DUF2922 domain-containing protein [Defluviitaleaceae bacterium]|nr:DUF2922 domain-containing protein [Defluviitaleaceae bacterium]